MLESVCERENESSTEVRGLYAVISCSCLKSTTCDTFHFISGKWATLMKHTVTGKVCAGGTSLESCPSGNFCSVPVGYVVVRWLQKVVLNKARSQKYLYQKIVSCILSKSQEHDGQVFAYF